MIVQTIKGYALVTVIFGVMILSISQIFIQTADDVFIHMALDRIEALK
jgi:hypothetical protein